MKQLILEFDFRRRGQTLLWVKGGYREVDVPGDVWHDQETRVEVVNDRLVRVSVFDAGARNPETGAVDFREAAALADEAFRQRFPDRSLAEPE
jgi:hypothetical protein